jgi:hypothetical protein
MRAMLLFVTVELEIAAIIKTIATPVISNTGSINPLARQILFFAVNLIFIS